MVTKEALRTAEGRAQFVKDFEFICKKDLNVKWEDQVAKLREYDWFLKETSIKEKMTLLDMMSNDEQEILTSIWPNFKRWIDAESCITSLEIKFELKSSQDPPKEKAENPGAGTPSKTDQSEKKKWTTKGSQTPTTPKSKALSLFAKLTPGRSAEKKVDAKTGLLDEKKQEEPSPPANEEKHSIPSYSIKIGTYQTIYFHTENMNHTDRKEMEDPDHAIDIEINRPLFDPAVCDFSQETSDFICSNGTLKYRREGYNLTVKESLPMRVYQKWVYEFHEKTDGTTFYKSYVIEGWKEGFKTSAAEAEEDFLGSEGVVHEAARFLYKFISDMQENFVEEVTIDTPFWSQRYDLPNFPHLKKLSICHHRREATEWWMKRFKTMKPIFEIELKANRDKTFSISKDFANWRQLNTFKNSEASEYILPVKGFSGKPVHYAEHPMFWAQKLTSAPCIQMRLRDIQHMFCLSELKINMTQLMASEVNEFLHMWNAGVLGHRLVRIAIDLDYAERFVNVKKEGSVVHPVFEDFAGNDYLEITKEVAAGISDNLKKCVVRPDYFSFVLYRNWTQPDGIKPPPEHVRESALMPIPENNVAGTSTKPECKGSDSGYDSQVTNSGGNSRTHSLSTDNGYDLEQHKRGSVCYKPSMKIETVRVQKKKELTWIGGSCAVIQFKKTSEAFNKERGSAFQTAFHFTAVRNHNFAEELLKLRK